MTDRRVLISGAGIAGPTLAYWLLRAGWTPTIVERAPAPRAGGYMIDFWGVGYDVADRMGLVPAIERDGYHIDELRIVDAAGRQVAGLDASLFEAASGGRYASLLRGDLATAIYELVDGRVETLFGDSVVGVNDDGAGVTVQFEQAQPRRFELVIGADGLHSNIRALALGHASDVEKHLGYYAAAFSADAYPHRDPGVYVSYATPGHQVARYALRDGRSVFFFILARPKAIDLMSHDVRAQQAIVRDAFRGAGWECDEILARMDEASDFYFDAVAQTRLERWSRGRVSLVGDAAYCPSLLAGQGSAFAMAGAYVLASALARTPNDHAAAFAAYEQSFKPFIDGKQRAAARFGSWFAPRTPIGLWIRNKLTSAMGLPFVGRITAKRAFSDRFELPVFSELPR